MSSPRRHHHVHGAAVAADGLSLGLESVFQELQERREENDRLREEMEHVKVSPPPDEIYSTSR